MPDASVKVFVQLPRRAGEAERPRPARRSSRARCWPCSATSSWSTKLAEAATDETVARADTVLVEEQTARDAADRAARDELTAEDRRGRRPARSAAAKRKACEQISHEELVLLAPRAGVVGQAPAIDDVGKFYERNRRRDAVLHHRRAGQGCASACRCRPTEFNRLKDNLERNSPASNETRRLLQRGVTAHYRSDAAGRRVRRPAKAGSRAALQGRRGGRGAATTCR